MTDGFIKLRAPVARATVSKINVRESGHSTACEIFLSTDQLADGAKASSHTFTLDQTAASKVPSQAKGARYIRGEAGQYIVATPRAITVKEAAASRSSISLKNTEATLNQEVFVLLVAYNEGEVTLSGNKKGRGVWALVLRRASGEVEAYERIGLIWPVLGGFPAQFDKVSGDESCGAFLETDEWLKNAEVQTLLLV